MKTQHTFKNLFSGYDFINPDITEKNFPLPNTIETEGWKILKMDTSFSSQKALDTIKAQGYRPATIHELALFKQNHPDQFPDNTWKSILAFGTDFIDSDGDHRVPYVCRDSDGDWKFDLGNFEDGWSADHCLLCLCDKNTSKPLTTQNDIDSLTLAIETVKAAGYKVIKEV